MTSLRPGIYQHYKGGTYRVLGTARHSETEEWVVIYQACEGDRGYWVRPLIMFEESVDVNGVLVPRFQWQSAGTSRPSTSAALADASDRKATIARTTKPHPASDTSETPQATLADSTPASLDERIRAAMSDKNDKPDFSHLPLFENQATALGFVAGVLVLLLALWWLI